MEEYSIGDIDDLLTGDTAQFEDKFFVLDDIGDKLKKGLQNSSQLLYMKI